MKKNRQFGQLQAFHSIFWVFRKPKRMPFQSLLQYSFILTIVLFSNLVSSQTRKYSNEFLSIGVDARAFAMGNNVVATQQDVNANYCNPAGLANITEGWQAAAMHAEYFQSMAKYDYAAFAIPLRNTGTLALSIIRFGVDDIINTTELIDSEGNIDYNRLSTFSTADYAANISFAGNFFSDSRISLGANAKMVYRHMGKFATSYGFGIDAGLQYHTDDNFHFGVMARDITTTFNVWNINEDELRKIEVQGVTLNNPPEETLEFTLPKLALGLGKDFEVNDKVGVTGELDLNFQFTQTNDLISTSGFSFSPSVGVEVNYDKLVYLRGGVNNLQTTRSFDEKKEFTLQPNLGIGVKLKGISIDYALTNVGNASVALYSNIFSVKFDISEWE